MIPWILLGVLILIIGILYFKTRTDTFVDFDTALTQRQLLQFEGERRYNDFARVQSPTSMLKHGDVDAALQQAIPVPTSNTSSLLSLLGFQSLGAADDGSNKVGSGVEQTGMVQEKINFCEAQHVVDCSKLDDPRYTECGVCHRDGLNSKGKAWRGMMYISAEDQIRANERANVSGGAAVYKPTVGSCDPKNFTLMNENCQVKEAQMQCQQAGAPTMGNNCGQCYGASPANATGLLFMAPIVNGQAQAKNYSFPAVLNLSHPGMGGTTVTNSSGQIIANLPPSNYRILDPQSYTLQVPISELDSLTIVVKGMPRVWCGWLSDPSGKRTVSLDVAEQSITPQIGFQIAGDKNAAPVAGAMAGNDNPAATFSTYQSFVPNTVLWYQRRDDAVLPAVVQAFYGNQPNINGAADVSVLLKEALQANQPATPSAEYYPNNPTPQVPNQLWVLYDNGTTVSFPDNSTVQPVQIQNTMTMVITVPATLADPRFADDIADCPTGPIVTTPQGAGIMGSHSCFLPDGSFNSKSQYCLQELFQAAGGTPQGTLFPNTDAKTAALVVPDSTGKPSLDLSVAAMNNGANIAMYGMDLNGSQASFDEFKAAAMQYLGATITNPCETETMNTGPHPPECLDYLWRTSGWNPQQDATNNAEPTSLPYANCSAVGTMAPGSSAAATATANAQGGVAQVRAFYKGIYDRSQNTADYDDQVAAMQQCFNVNIMPPPQDPGSCPPPEPSDLQCFGPDKSQNPEVFYVMPPPPGGGYAYATREEAQQACESFGATLATYDQLQQALGQGADWCASGWIADSYQGQSAWYPTQIGRPGCGTGMSAYFPGAANANCWGKKPLTPTPGILPYQTPGLALQSGGQSPGIWNNPAALWVQPPTFTPVVTSTPQGIQCLTNDGQSCFDFSSSDNCATWLAQQNNTAPPGTPAYSGPTPSMNTMLVANANNGPTMQYVSNWADNYMRVRV